MPINKELQQRIERLEELLAAQSGRPAPPSIVKPEDRLDYIEFGSARHAEFLGLTEDSDSPVGWRLTDPTQYGAMARPEFLENILHQKVTELVSGKPPAPQSVDRGLPNYAPPMWTPDSAFG